MLEPNISEEYLEVLEAHMKYYCDFIEYLKNRQDKKFIAAALDLIPELEKKSINLLLEISYIKHELTQ
jgi:hypothetical protein